LDFTTLKSIQTVYPKYIKQYKDILLDPNSDVETKVDTIVQSLNRVSANEQQLVNNWNQVMQWAMNDGLDAAVSTQIAALEASGYFDSLLTSLFNSELGTETLATTSQDIKGAINEVKGVADSNTSALADRATDIMQRGINVKYPFGTNLTPAKGDGVTDDTSAIQAIINYSISTNRKVFFPASNYLVNGNLTINDQVELEGVYTSDPNKTANNRGTVFITNSGTGAVLSIIGTSASRIVGFRLSNISFLGSDHWNTNSNSVNRICLDIEYTAREIHIENINICGFLQQGVYMSDVYDGDVKGLSICYCGTDNTYAGLHITGTTGDTSNALKFFNLHIEFCPYMLRLGNVRHIHFIGCKFETGQTTFPLNSPIFINATAFEIDFISCQMILQSADNVGWSSPSVVPYLMTIANNWTKIIGCTFSSPTNSGSKWINHTGTGGIIDDNIFNTCFGGAISIVLGSQVRFANNQSQVTVYSGQASLLSLGTENQVDGNIINVVGTATNGSCYTVTGSNNLFGINRILGAFSSYLSDPNNHINYTFFNPVWKSQRTLLAGATSIPANMSDVTCSHIFWTNNSSATTINNIAKSYMGQEIMLVAKDANTTLQNIGASSNILLKGGTNVTIPNNGIMKFFHDGTNWLEFSRNF
jgi:hypothetical protein